VTNQFVRTRTTIRSSLNLEFRRAILGDWNGVVNDPFYLNSGRVWVRYLTSNGYSMPVLVRGPYAASVPLKPDHAVIIEYDTDNQPYVARTDFDTVRSGGGLPIPIPTPPGGDYVTQDQIVTLRCSQTIPASLYVMISGWKPIVNGVAYNFPGEVAFELSSFVPVSGHCCVGVFMQSDLVTPIAYASTAIGLDDDLSIDDVNAVLAQVALTCTPVWFYDVKAAVTQIFDTDTLLDGRQLVNAATQGRAAISIANVGSPPSAGDITSAFGAPGVVGAGFVGIINDNGADTDFWLCISDGVYWTYSAMTKAT
jgi:hypothetical protein